MPEHPEKVYEGDYFSGATQGFGYTDYDADKLPMVPTFKTYLDRIAHYLAPAPGRKILDVGAATGFFLNLAREAGWETAGIEPSESAAQMARDQKKLDVRAGLLEPGVYEPGSFDVITLWDVIEHVPDPLAFSRLVHSLLKPGGIYAINTPDASSWYGRAMGEKWHALCPPEHLALFTNEALDQLLNKSGFQLLERGKIGKSFTVQYILQTLGHWQKSKMLFSLSQGLSKIGVGGISIPLNLRDNVFLLARKAG